MGGSPVWFETMKWSVRSSHVGLWPSMYDLVPGWKREKRARAP